MRSTASGIFWNFYFNVEEKELAFQLSPCFILLHFFILFFWGGFSLRSSAILILHLFRYTNPSFIPGDYEGASITQESYRHGK